jgi:hypothetical protein
MDQPRLSTERTARPSLKISLAEVQGKWKSPHHFPCGAAFPKW